MLSAQLSSPFRRAPSLPAPRDRRYPPQALVWPFDRLHYTCSAPRPSSTASAGTAQLTRQSRGTMSMLNVRVMSSVPSAGCSSICVDGGGKRKGETRVERAGGG